MKIIHKGNGPHTISVVGGVHGDETLGIEIVNRLQQDNPLLHNLLLVIANEEAAAQGKRFLEKDLNRCFPGGNETHEERLARKILEKLQDCNYVIDVHSTTAETENFVVVTNNEGKAIARAVPLQKIVWMNRTIASGKALIDHVPGISLEFDRRTPVETAEQVVRETIERLQKKLTLTEESAMQEQYLVYGTLPKNQKATKLKNFEETTLNGETFYPVLHGERAYTETECLKARKEHKKRKG